MMDFAPRLKPASGASRAAYWFIFLGDRLLVRLDLSAVASPASPQVNGREVPDQQAATSESARRDAWRVLTGVDSARVPLLEAPQELGLSPVRVTYLGFLVDEGEETDCYAAEVAPETPLPAGYAAEGLRALYPVLPEPFMAVAGRAVQLVAYERQNQFCGQCGARAVDQEHERARRCPQCGLVVYPRLSPAMIIAVTRHTGDGLKILLARNHRFPPGRFSVLAGYVEPGESLEACCAREVCEEVGVDITNIRYFGSQPWPFPNSLMIGFTAEYAAGEIKLEESELAEARWFAASELPGIPPPFTIARRLIDWFIDVAQVA